MNPMRAIRLKCLDCSGDSPKEVVECTCEQCALYPFRLGKNPFRKRRTLTDEQKEAAAVRLSAARSKRENPTEI